MRSSVRRLALPFLSKLENAASGTLPALPPQPQSFAQLQGATVPFSSWWPRWSSSNSTTPVEEAEPAAHKEGAAEPKSKDEAGPSTSSSSEGAVPEGDQGQDKGPTREQLLAALKEKDGLLEEANKKVEEARDSVLRARADAQNLLDRTKREVENARQFALQGFVKSILEVADNLERAVQAVPPEMLDAAEGAGKEKEVDPVKLANTLKNVIVGVQMTDKTLVKVFAQHGVERFSPLGEAFDPNLHQALFEAPMPDKVDRTIIQVIKSGYKLNGRVVRPADVGVVRDGKPAPPAAEGQGEAKKD